MTHLHNLPTLSATKLELSTSHNCPGVRGSTAQESTPMYQHSLTGSVSTQRTETARNMFRFQRLFAPIISLNRDQFEDNFAKDKCPNVNGFQLPAPNLLVKMLFVMSILHIWIWPYQYHSQEIVRKF